MIGRARLVGFEERDRDCCFHSVTVRVDMPTFKTDCNIKFLLYKQRGSLRADEIKSEVSYRLHAG